MTHFEDQIKKFELYIALTYSEGISILLSKNLFRQLFKELFEHEEKLQIQWQLKPQHLQFILLNLHMIKLHFKPKKSFILPLLLIGYSLSNVWAQLWVFSFNISIKMFMHGYLINFFLFCTKLLLLLFVSDVRTHSFTWWNRGDIYMSY